MHLSIILYIESGAGLQVGYIPRIRQFHTKNLTGPGKFFLLRSHQIYPDRSCLCQIITGINGNLPQAPFMKIKHSNLCYLNPRCPLLHQVNQDLESDQYYGNTFKEG